MSTDTYKGDIFYETLKRHIHDNGIAEKFEALAIEAGLKAYHKPAEQDASFFEATHYYDRLFDTVVTKRVDFLRKFDELLKDEGGCKEFLSELNEHVSARGRELMAVPEDVLTFLVLRDKGDYLTKKFIHENAGFRAEVNEAIIDVLELK